jgi:site-specific recombinase XerD
MQEFLGHFSIVMTPDIYSHVLPSTKAEEIKKLSGMFD